MLKYKMRKTHRRTHRRTTRRTNKRKSRSKSRSKSGSKPSVHNSVSQCVPLFRKYRLTSLSKLVKWMNNNHPDKGGSKQSSKLQDDYKLITGCFAQRKQILKQLKSKSKSKSKSKKKVKKIKGGTWAKDKSWEDLTTIEVDTATGLGWSEKTWGKRRAGPLDTVWSSLTETQKSQAVSLGYGENDFPFLFDS